ncbi:hypothetical protein GCM10007304_11090 [Rhodococcoides trifolii]|uniref:Beta-lactamase-related domain-containing protein n=2 Tax=Rhodococcoides trifolii TaxID=908250 RepID=A0A917FR85_9NOCA|nr:hypothetical protein GCM10007304_11090 [Rhodococcus trifolii]
MAAQIVDVNGVVAEAASGVDLETPFVWGSVSKQLTAATVTGLGIDRARAVVDAVPQARGMLVDPSVTVDDLVHHTSGLPHDITVTDDWSRRGSATDAVASIAAPDGTSPRGTFRYSSLNYLLLQAVIEQHTGGTFADAVTREVLEPSGATSTITDPDAFVRDVPPGHVPFFGTARAIDVGIDAAGLGYGYLAGSITDLGRYASWRLGELQGGEKDVRGVDTGHGTEYANGLYREDIGGQNVWWHSGAVPGYYTYVGMIPDTDTAVVLASNRYGEMESERIAAVGRNLTTMVLDGSTTDLPSSLATTVVGVLLGLAAVLLAVAVWIVTRFATGRTRRRSVRGAVVRGTLAVVLGSVVVVGALLGVPAVVGASLPVMWLWAPDVTVAFWVLLAAVLATTVVVVVSQVVSRRPTTH